MKTINNETFAYSIPSNTVVIELKRLLRDSTSIDIPRQRLIFRGRVLQDNLTLTDYSVVTGHVLHMVARPIDAEHSPEPSADANRNVRQNIQNTTSEYGFPQFRTGSENAPESTSQATQLQRLSRAELEMLNQLMSGEAIMIYEFTVISNRVISHLL